MDIRKIIICTLLVLTLLPLCIKAQQVEIRCTVKPLKGEKVIFGYYFGSEKKMMVSDTLKTDANGTAVISRDKALPQGMYFLYVPGHGKLDMIVGSQQRFSVTTDTASMAAGKFTGSTDNEVFAAYNRYNQEKYAEFRTLSQQYSQADAAAKPAIRSKINALTSEKDAHIAGLLKAHPNTMVGKVLGALMEPDVPDAPQGADANWQARWYRRHYFDHFDMADSSLLRTPFYESRLLGYFSQCVPNVPDSINLEIDNLLNKVRFSPELFRFNLVTLWNSYVQSKQMGIDAVWVKLARKWYLPYGTWVTADDRQLIEEQVARKEHNLLGMTAPPLEQLMSLPSDHFKLAKTDTTTRYDLHAGTMVRDFRQSVHSEYTVLFFWDVTCSHCREFILKLRDVLPTLKKYDVTVMTVQILISREGKSKWVDYINENSLYDWTNTWSPYSAAYRQLYDTEQVPILYVLDKDKKIIAKQLQPEQLEGLLQYEQQKKTSTH